MTRRALVLLAACLGALVLSGCLAPPPPPDPGPPWDARLDTIYRHVDGYLICVRAHESDRDDRNRNGLHDAGYWAQPANGHKGAYQFAQSTWDTQARAIGRGDLAGRNPATVWIIDQDLVAWTLSQGTHAPWAGSGC